MFLYYLEGFIMMLLDFSIISPDMIIKCSKDAPLQLKNNLFSLSDLYYLSVALFLFDLLAPIYLICNRRKQIKIMFIYIYIKHNFII